MAAYGGSISLRRLWQPDFVGPLPSGKEEWLEQENIEGHVAVSELFLTWSLLYLLWPVLASWDWNTLYKMNKLLSLAHSSHRLIIGIVWTCYLLYSYLHSWKEVRPF